MSSNVHATTDTGSVAGARITYGHTGTFEGRRFCTMARLCASAVRHVPNGAQLVLEW